MSIYCHSEHGWMGVHMKTECMPKCTTSRVNKFANSKKILTSKFLIKGIPLFLTALAMHPYDNNIKISVKSYGYTIMIKTVSSCLSPCTWRFTRRTWLLPCAPRVWRGAGKGNKSWEKGQRDKGTAALPHHVSSVCYQPEFLQGLLFLCYNKTIRP